jgi:trehalose-phosphatase
MGGKYNYRIDQFKEGRMKYFSDEWSKIRTTLAGKNILLFLDYDGTLSEIVDDPDLAVVSDAINRSLKTIADNPRFQIVIISGRSLKDITQKIQIKNAIISGNHGLEIEGPDFIYTHTVPPLYSSTLFIIKNKLHSVLGKYKGVWIEDKYLSLCVHYRLAEKEQIPEIKDTVRSTLARYVSENKIKLKSGKMILEVMPSIHWNKGLAVNWILSHLSEKHYFPVYFGDDSTDEDAFKELEGSGLTVLVGKRKDSCAQYFVNTVSEVGDVLQKL